MSESGTEVTSDLPDYSDAVKVLDEALTELQVVEDIDQAWSLLDYLAQQGWDLVRRESEPNPFAPGTRVDVHELDDGYLVIPKP